MRPEDILRPMPSGLCSPIGDFHIDPTRPVERALITHGHSDHARAGHGAVLATQETLDMMRLRYGANFAGSTQAVALRRETEAWACRGVVSSRGPCARLGADLRRRKRHARGRVGRLQGCAGPDLRAVRADPVRCLHHRGDVRTAGVPAWRRQRRDRQTVALGRAVSRARASGRRVLARQGAARDRADPRGRLRQADLPARRDGEHHALLRLARDRSRRIAPRARRHARRSLPARSRSARPLRCRTAGRGAFPIRSRPSRPAGCACAHARASAASSCRW